MEDGKYVDEGWKESVAKEKESKQDQEPMAESQNKPLHDHSNDIDAQTQEVNFISYIMSLAYQAMIFLGDAPNPIDNKTTVNLAQSKLLIDTLAMLMEKTSGNLDDQETNALNSVLYELRMRYVEITSQKVQK